MMSPSGRSAERDLLAGRFAEADPVFRIVIHIANGVLNAVPDHDIRSSVGVLAREQPKSSDDQDSVSGLLADITADEPLSLIARHDPKE